MTEWEFCSYFVNKCRAAKAVSDYLYRDCCEGAVTMLGLITQCFSKWELFKDDRIAKKQKEMEE